MQSTPTPFNPFMLMMAPETVLDAMAHSKDLRRLRHHKYRPLDRPWIPLVNVKKTVDSLVKSSVEAAGVTTH